MGIYLLRVMCGKGEALCMALGHRSCSGYSARGLHGRGAGITFTSREGGRSAAPDDCIRWMPFILNQGKPASSNNNMTYKEAQGQPARCQE